MGNFNNKSKWEDVQKDEEALKYHCARYLLGDRYPVAIYSFQFIKQREFEVAKKEK
jgi:hypothetical protein